MSSSEGGGGSSDDQPEESVEYSGGKADGVMYLVFGVISIVVIVVVVLLVVFLMNRNTTTAEPAMKSTSPGGSKCTNPCMGAGKVCHPDSKKDADGCFVQDCHCYSPTPAHTCSNPCNATGQVCHFSSPMDEHGCYMPSCRCITCKQQCPMDKKCDPNTPSEPDGCPMSGCTCVPMMCPARCPSGRQCSPDAPTDVNGCFDMDCMCVPVSLPPTPPSIPTVDTPKPCPVICPANYSCHKMQPVDPSGCYVAPCPCIHDFCPNQCPAGEICELNTPIDSSGCLMSGCTCVKESGHVPPVVTTKATVVTKPTTAPAEPDVTGDLVHTTDLPNTAHGGRALEHDAGKGGVNGTDGKDGAPVLKRSPPLPENGNGSEARDAQDPGDNATVPHSPAYPDGPPDTLSKGNHSEDGTVQQSSTAQGELSTPSASGDSATGSANDTDREVPSQDERSAGSEETSVKSEQGHSTELHGGEGSSDVSADKLASTEEGMVSEGDKSTKSKEAATAADGNTASAPATSTAASDKSEKGESPPPNEGERTTKDTGEEAVSSEKAAAGEDASGAEAAAATDHNGAGEPAGAAEPSTVAPAGSSEGEQSGPRVRRSINAAAFPVLEPPAISLSKVLVKGASTALNATRIFAQSHRGGVRYPDDTNAKYAPILMPSVGASTSIELQPHAGKEGTFERNITRRHGV